MTRMPKAHAAKAPLPMLATAVDAATLRWAGQQDIFSLDPYSCGSPSNPVFLNHEGLARYAPGAGKVDSVVIRADSRQSHRLTHMAE